LFYGVEAWTTTDATLKRLSAYFENILDGTHHQHGSHAEIGEGEGSRLYKRTEAGVFWSHTKT